MSRIEEIETRLSAIKAEVELEGADITALSTETDSLLEERKALLDAVETRKATLAKIANLPAAQCEDITIQEDNSMEMTRNSKEYVNAYAEYIKTGDDTQVRSLLTENVSGGTVAVPDVVVSAIQTAWDNEPIMALVKKTFLKGNVKIGFEISATGAVEHTEGGAAVTEEELVLGIATLTPVSVKKWISVSDEALDLSGDAFLQYIYSELGYQIAKKVADEIIADIVATNGTGSATVPAQAVIAAAPGLATIATAIANLSDEATNPVVIMNKLTYADFKAVQAGANYGQDVFDGLQVVFNNSLPAYGTASTGDTYAIVGDLGRGAIANFPNGQEIEFKFDDKVLMTQDLVRVLGRMYVGHGVVAPKTFTKITKPVAG